MCGLRQRLGTDHRARIMNPRAQAAALIERDGLLQGAPYAHHQGRSIIGAIQSVVNFNPLQSSAGSRKLISEVAAELGVDDLQAWNDEEGRTAEEVITALRGGQAQQSFL